jgi:fucose permease
MGGSQAVLAVAVSGAFLFGLVVVLLGCLKSQLAGRLGVPPGRVAGLWAAMNLVLVPTTFLGGVLADTWDVRWVFLIGTLLVCLALFALGSAGTMGGALAAFLLTGVGGGFLCSASLVLMPLGFFGPTEAAASLNFGNVFFALGAMLAPTLADVLLRGTGYRRTLATAALLALVPAVLVVFLPASQLGAERPQRDVAAVVFDPRVWLAGLVFFLYAPLEGCLHTWGTTYLQNMGHPERKAARLVSAFWTAFLLGRLAMAYLQHWRILDAGWDPWVVVILALAATVMLANMAGTVRRASATWGLLLLGFFLGPVFPTLVAFLFRLSPDLPGTAFGTMFAIGSAGSLVVAPLISARFHRKSAQSALRIPLVLGMLLTITALFFGLAFD